MLKDDELVGAIAIYRQEVRPFTDKQIELVTKLRRPGRHRHREHAAAQRTARDRGSLEQQTATSEVLKVISSSPGELEPVFNAMLEKAARICGAKFGMLFLPRATLPRPSPCMTSPREFAEERRPRANGLPRDCGKPVGPHHADEAGSAHRRYQDRAGLRRRQSTVNGRSPTWVARGLLSPCRCSRTANWSAQSLSTTRRYALHRQTDRAGDELRRQAVIAIENTRLLNELRQRTDDLSESLHQQTATSEVLKVISSSPNDTQPVFEAIVRSGLNLFPDAAISVVLPDGDQVRAAAFAEPDPARAKAWRRRFPFPLTREYMHSVAILDGRVVDIPDVENAPAELGAGAQNFLASGYRALTIMPLMRGDAAIGALSVVRLASGPLSDKQLALLKTFADQAVIAIENTRLLNELRQRTDDLTKSLEQQTATSEVLQVISSSPGDLEPVFEAMLANAVRLCEASTAFCSATKRAHSDKRPCSMYHRHMPISFGNVGGFCLSRASPSTACGEQRSWSTRSTKQHRRTRPRRRDSPVPDRTSSCPMLKDNELVGAIVIYRQEVRPFTEKQIELVKNFAAQAVIAIENTRLLNELRESSSSRPPPPTCSRSSAARPSICRRCCKRWSNSAARLCDADKGNIIARERWSVLSVPTAYGYLARIHGLCQRYAHRGRPRLGSRARAT